MRSIEELRRLSGRELSAIIAELDGWVRDQSVSVPPGKQKPWKDPGAARWMDELPDWTKDHYECRFTVTRMSVEEKHAYAVILAGMLWLPENTRGWQDWRDTLAISEATCRDRTIAMILAKQKPDVSKEEEKTEEPTKPKNNAKGKKKKKAS